VLLDGAPEDVERGLGPAAGAVSLQQLDEVVRHRERD
jgi:hypothetical protein